MIRTLIPAVIALGGLGLAPAAANAAGVLVFPFEHPGLDAATAEALDAAIREEVKDALPKLELLPPPALALSDLSLAAGCVDASPKCLARIGRTLRAARVVRVVGEGSSDALDLEITVVRTRRGQAETYTARMLDVDAESAAELRWHVGKALGRRLAPLVGRIELYTASKVGSLAGAELFVDDERVPAGALDRLTPGQHRVEVRQQGFETFIWLGQVRPARTTRVAVRFEPKQGPAPAVATPTTPEIGAAPPPPGPAAPAAPAAGVQASPGDDEAPRLVFTWVFAASTVVAASAGTILAVQARSDTQKSTDEGLTCKSPETADYDLPFCRAARAREIGQFVTWGITGALGAAAVAAFFLEDGPSLFSEEGEVAIGVSPGPGGVAASLRVAF